MNLLYYRVRDDVTYGLLMALTLHYKPDNCYLVVGRPPYRDLLKNHKIHGCNIAEVYHERQINFGIYSGYIFDEQCPPVDEDLLKSMSANESTIMKMLERTRYLSDQPDYEQRVRLYHTHIRYWNYMLDAASIDVVVFSWTPHKICDYIIYCLCKIKGIAVAMCQRTEVPGFTYTTSEITVADKRVLETYNRLAAQLKDTPIEQIDIKPAEMQRAYDLYTQRDTFEATPQRTYIKHKIDTAEPSFRKNLRKHLGRIKKNGLFSHIISHIKYDKNSTRGRRKLHKAYDRLSAPADFSKPYIYFALHEQPECSSNPLGGVFVHQYLAVSMLSFYLPKHIEIYVKEHPTQSIRPHGRDLRLYSDLAKLPNVTLVDRKTDARQLLEHCIATASLTGSVGFEGQFIGKPFLMFGYQTKMYAPGTFNIRNNRDCEEAIRHIVGKGAKHTLKDMKIYMKALGEVIPHCNTQLSETFKELGLVSYTEEENIERVLCEVVRVIDEQL